MSRGNGEARDGLLNRWFRMWFRTPGHYLLEAGSGFLVKLETHAAAEQSRVAEMGPGKWIAKIVRERPVCQILDVELGAHPGSFAPVDIDSCR